MGVNKAIALVGLALQAARGSAQDQPSFAHGIYGGKIGPELKNADDPVTSSYRFSTSGYRESIENGGDYTCPAYFKTIGCYLYGVMGGVDTVAGTHTFTVADTLPFWTFWAALDDGRIVRLDDSKISEVSIKWEGNKPAEVSVTLLGCEMFGLRAGDEPVTMVPLVTEGGDDRFTPVGGSFKVAVDGVAAEAQITGGEIKMTNKVERRVVSGSLQANDVQEATFEAEITVTVMPDDLDLWADACSDEIVYGAFEFGFGIGDETLVLSGDRVPFVVPPYDVDPGGGSVELELTGLAKGTIAGASPITAVLENSVTAYDEPVS